MKSYMLHKNIIERTELILDSRQDMPNKHFIWPMPANVSADILNTYLFIHVHLIFL